MTLKNAKAVQNCIKANGDLEGFQMARIYRYKSALTYNDDILFALFENAAYDDMVGNPYVREVVLLFDNPTVTEEGKIFLSQNLEKGMQI